MTPRCLPGTSPAPCCSYLARVASATALMSSPLPSKGNLAWRSSPPPCESSARPSAHRVHDQGETVSVDDALREDAQALAPDLIQLRRQLHRHPEVGLHLPLTQRIVLKALEGVG